MSNFVDDSKPGMTDFLEILQEEIHTWIFIQRRERRITMQQAWQELSDALGVSDRQVQRYFTGDTPIPSDRIIPFCKLIKSNRLVHHLNFELGIEACDAPDIEGMDTADIAEALVQAVQRFGQQAGDLSKSFLRGPNEADMRKIRAGGRRARAEILGCEKLYEAMLQDRQAAMEQKALLRKRKRAERIRRSLEAKGQLSFLDGGEDEEES